MTLESKSKFDEYKRRQNFSSAIHFFLIIFLFTVDVLIVIFLSNSYNLIVGLMFFAFTLIPFYILLKKFVEKSLIGDR